MTYSHNSNDPMVLLAATAENLLNQYDSNIITLEQLKNSLNNQIIPLVPSLDKSSHNDNAWHTITQAVAMVDAVE